MSNDSWPIIIPLGMAYFSDKKKKNTIEPDSPLETRIWLIVNSSKFAKFVTTFVNIPIDSNRKIRSIDWSIDSSLVRNHEFSSFHSSLSKNKEGSIRYHDTGAEIEGGSHPAEAEGRGQKEGTRDKLTEVDEWAHPDQLVRFDGIVHDYPAEDRI